MLLTNDPEKITRLIRRLWVEKHDPDISFPHTKRKVLKSALQQLTQEVAVVLDTTREEAKKSITSQLKKLKKS